MSDGFNFIPAEVEEIKVYMRLEAERRRQAAEDHAATYCPHKAEYLDLKEGNDPTNRLDWCLVCDDCGSVRRLTEKELA